jgi:hypothetical protein
MSENSIKYLTSNEAKEKLKIQDCDLAHIRNSGNLQYIKKGNSYLYLVESVEKFKQNRVKEKQIE